jgi:hypothetical protein
VTCMCLHMRACVGHEHDACAALGSHACKHNATEDAREYLIVERAAFDPEDVSKLDRLVP